MPCLQPSRTNRQSTTTNHQPTWRAGNPARSRLSGGRRSACAGPQERLSSRDQSGLHRILFNIRPNSIEFLIGTNQAVEALVLPKWPVCTKQTVGFMSSKPFKWSQPLIGRYMGSCQKMHMIRHHDKCMQFVSVQCGLAMPHGSYNHRRYLRSSQKQRAVRAFVQKSIYCHEGFSCRHQSFRRKYSISRQTTVQAECDKHGLTDNVPMGKATFIVPHILSCWERTEILRETSRLKAGCGQDCPPSNTN